MHNHKEETSNFSNCHRTKSKQNQTTDSKIGCNSNPSTDYQTDSDTDSSTSKYVVREDKRERRDGPGGN